MRGLFVTGTDTGVGKTVVSAMLLQRYARDLPVRYWKPIQTGIERDDDTATVTALAGSLARSPVVAGVRLPRPLSPHLSARRAGQAIDLDALEAIAGQQSRDERFIVEGAGGVLVPVTETALMADFIARLGLPAVVVARTTLGTINHTLLTVEALRARGLEVAGVVMNGSPNRDNREAIAKFGHVDVLGEIPPLALVDGTSIEDCAAAFDHDGRLCDMWLR